MAEEGSDVLIVGAGLAGATAAGDLGARGLRITILEGASASAGAAISGPSPAPTRASISGAPGSPPGRPPYGNCASAITSSSGHAIA